MELLPINGVSHLLCSNRLLMMCATVLLLFQILFMLYPISSMLQKHLLESSLSLLFLRKTVPLFAELDIQVEPMYLLFIFCRFSLPFNLLLVELSLVVLDFSPFLHREV